MSAWCSVRHLDNLDRPIGPLAETRARRGFQRHDWISDEIAAEPSGTTGCPAEAALFALRLPGW